MSMKFDNIINDLKKKIEVTRLCLIEEMKDIEKYQNLADMHKTRWEGLEARQTELEKILKQLEELLK